jgi:O-antigen/teichoic acid export membrane protein
METHVRKLGFKANFAYALLGNILHAASQWVMLVLLTKLGSVGMLGLFGLATAICTPVATLTNFHLAPLYITDFKNDARFAEYLNVRTLSSLLALGIVAVAAQAYGREIVAVTVLWSFAQLIVNIKDMYVAVMQKHERMDLYSVSKSVNAVLSALLFGAVLFLTRDLVPALASVIAVRLAVLLAFDYPVVRRRFETRSFERGAWPLRRQALEKYRSIVRYALPQGIIMSLITLQASLPRFFLGSHFNEREVGFFTATSSFMAAGTLVVGALAESTAPRLTALYHNDLARYKKLLLCLSLFGLAIGLAGVACSMLLGPRILTLFFTPDYASQAPILTLVMWASIPYFISSFLNNGLLISRTIVPQAYVYVLAGLVSLGLCALLVGEHGQAGGAVAMLGGALVTMLGTGWLNWIVYRRRKQALAASGKAAKTEFLTQAAQES